MNDILKVVLDVDTSTGELKATYPAQYSGSTFSLSGETLMLTTPEGMEIPLAYISDGEVFASIAESGVAKSLFEEYINALKKGNFHKCVRLDFLQEDGSVAFSLGNVRKRGYMRKYDTRAFIESGTLNVNMQNGQRRTANITLADLDEAFNYNINNVWFGRQVRLMMGVKLDDGTDYYLPQGVFYVKNPTKRLNENTKTITYNLVDKWSYLNGDLFGKLDGTYQVPSGAGTNIFSAIRSVLELSRYGFAPTADRAAMIDNTTPVFTSYYNGKTYTLADGTTAAMTEVPYTITSKSNGNLAEIILELNSIVAGIIGYDATGALCIEPSQEDIDDIYKPMVWEFTPENSMLSSINETYRDTDVYNDIIITGSGLDGNEIYGRATNMDANSDTNVFAIGWKTYRDTQSNYWNSQQCAALARYKLKRSAVLNKTISIEAQQVFHLRENRLISVKRTDKQGSPAEKHIIQSFSLPIGDTGAMTINATSIMDLPAFGSYAPSKTQLATPVLAISGNTLNITNVDTHAAMIMIYVNGNYADQILFPQTSSLTYDLSSLSLSTGSYNITAVAGADADSDYTPSETSNTVVYTVSVQQLSAPTVSISVNTLTVTAESRATTYQVYVDNVAVGSAVSVGNTTNLASLGIGGGSHTVSATVSASGYTTSDKATAVNWLVPSVTNVLNGCTNSNAATYVYLGQSYTATVSPSSGKSFSGGGQFSMTIGGVEASSYYSYNSGTDSYSISVPSVTADIGIGAIAVTTYTVTGVITNGSMQGGTISSTGTFTGTIVPSSNYGLPAQSDISVVNATLTAYNSSTGAVTIGNATGNVTITATCPASAVTYTLTNTLSNISVDGVEVNDVSVGSIPSTVLSTDVVEMIFTCASGRVLSPNISVNNVNVTVGVGEVSANGCTVIYSAVPNTLNRGIIVLKNFSNNSVLSCNALDVSQSVSYSADATISEPEIFDFSSVLQLTGNTNIGMFYAHFKNYLSNSKIYINITASNYDYFPDIGITESDIICIEPSFLPEAALEFESITVNSNLVTIVYHFTEDIINYLSAVENIDQFIHIVTGMFSPRLSTFQSTSYEFSQDVTYGLSASVSLHYGNSVITLGDAQTNISVND